MTARFLLAPLFLVLTCFIGCEDPQTCDCGDPAPFPGSIQIITGVPNDTLFIGPELLPSTPVIIILSSNNGTAMSGVAVDISLHDPTLGVLEFSDSLLLNTTDFLGRVYLIFRSFGEVGDQFIFASVGNISATRFLSIRQAPPQGTALSLTAVPQQLEAYADETVYSSITVRLVDNANRGIPNQSINISVNAGVLPAIPLTDSTGLIQFNWSFHDHFGSFWLVANSGVLRDSVNVEVFPYLEPPLLHVYLEPAVLWADSNESCMTRVTLIARDGFGQPILGTLPVLSFSGGVLTEPLPTDMHGETSLNWDFFNEFGTFMLAAEIEHHGITATDSAQVTVEYLP
ncbi:Ig-like domain-containing protein [bacterium]|nr:Ig-like domain-containing protein [bacterium]